MGKGMIITSDEIDHSREFPAFSTSRFSRDGDSKVKKNLFRQVQF